MAYTIPQASRDYDNTRIVDRPDGFYWHDENESDKVFGPFPTLLEAIQDMEYNAESDYEPGETLEQAEEEIGISSWIDQETGEPGEESFRYDNQLKRHLTSRYQRQRQLAKAEALNKVE